MAISLQAVEAVLMKQSVMVLYRNWRFLALGTVMSSGCNYSKQCSIT